MTENTTPPAASDAPGQQPTTPQPPENDGWFIPQDSRDYLLKLFAKFKEPVTLELFTKAGLNDKYNEFTQKFLGDLDRLTDKIVLRSYTLDDPHARERGVDRSPEILVAPDKYRLRFTGAPAGEEGRSFIETLLLASTGDSGLAPSSRELLAELDEPRQVTVFVSPTCPYCPGQVTNGARAAVERPDLVALRAVEIGENPDLAEASKVGSVPHTVMSSAKADDPAPRVYHVLGQEPEARFAVELLTLKPAEQWLREHGAPAGATAPGPQAREVDVVILGAGPAGLSAAIYVVRAGLSALVLDKGSVGGQVAVTPQVENYPGFPLVAGAKLVDILVSHAREYCDVREFVETTEIKIGRRIEVHTLGGEVFVCRALILAMGATWKQLGIPGEQKFFGQGVSYCASCDGYIYKGRTVAVVGGGNTAFTDALHLKHLGATVSIIHRRDAPRAEHHLQQSVEREGIPLVLDTVVTALEGDTALRGLKLRNVQTGEESQLAVDGLFVAIGQQANSQLARQIGIGVDMDGFIQVDAAMRTNIPRIYAAGDITGGIRQIVTAVGRGTTAALTVFEDLTRRGEE